MATLDFPFNPPVGTTYLNWLWDGAKWKRLAGSAAPRAVTMEQLAVRVAALETQFRARFG
jgi:hypothetical protein